MVHTCNTALHTVHPRLQGTAQTTYTVAPYANHEPTAQDGVWEDAKKHGLYVCITRTIRCPALFPPS